MTIHTGTPQTDTSRPDWASLDEASREKAVVDIYNRVITTLIADVRETAGNGAHTYRIMLSVAAQIVRMIGHTEPPPAITPEIFRAATFEAVRSHYFSGTMPPAIHQSPLTEAMAPGFLKTANDGLAVAARTLKAQANTGGFSHDAFLATAAAAHCIQMAALVVERAGAEGWSPDTAVASLHATARVTETIIRDAMARGAAFPEVMGNA